MIYRSQIVGMHFRPPAKAVLECLPANVELILEPEADNPYDEFAIKVLVLPKAVPESQFDDLREKCLSMGQDWDLLLSIGEPIHLGYCISQNNKKLDQWTPNTIVGDIIRQKDWIAELAFSDEGSAYVKLTVKENEDA